MDRLTWTSGRASIPELGQGSRSHFANRSEHRNILPTLFILPYTLLLNGAWERSPQTPHHRHISSGFWFPSSIVIFILHLDEHALYHHCDIGIFSITLHVRTPLPESEIHPLFMIAFQIWGSSAIGSPNGFSGFEDHKGFYTDKMGGEQDRNIGVLRKSYPNRARYNKFTAGGKSPTKQHSSQVSIEGCPEKHINSMLHDKI